MKFIAIIPARYASTRLPGKPLAMLAGKPVIQHVYEHVTQCAALSDAIVATDDERILNTVHGFGGNVVMTRADHKCGTDRCLEAMNSWLNQHTEVTIDELVVVNIQGDEPFVHPEQINDLCRCFENPGTDIATLARPYSPNDSWEDLQNPNTPKVVFDKDMRAILFSRSIIPYLRNVPQEQWLAHHTFYRHVGMYAYRATILQTIATLAPTSLELAESLEQLRWLENGYTIRVAVTHHASIGIDTPEDLLKAENLYVTSL